ncbi:hypothetical protein MMC20_007512 [Loxospora ochrophaea]|nr:hypothetical protein [Loxospora ochrophaea]
MKVSDIALALATAGSIVTAQPHHIRHRHADKVQRDPLPEPDVVTKNVVGPTVVAYEMNGELISENDVCSGIANGSLKLPEGAQEAPDCSSGSTLASTSIVPSTSAAPSLATTSSLQSESFAYTTSSLSTSSLEASSSVSPAASSGEGASTSASSAASSSSSTSDTPSDTVSDSSSSSSTPGGQGLDSEFPDGELDCSQFPSDYGPIEIEWLGIGGWSGIQYVDIADGMVKDISTAISGQSCTEGAMCSYACPAGYQKSQWPSTQGSTGQSVGGIACQDGKLRLTNPDLSKNLCIQGTGLVSVENQLNTNAAICRTDYPGTEDMTVPLNTVAGSTNPLTCPNAKTYYTHEGSPTSAQYYINNKGISEATACQWDSDGSDMGNWAPSYLGVGTDQSGSTWLSIASTAQNNPSNYQPLDYTVEITGDNLSGKCKLSGGQYCSGVDYSDCNSSGCTVEVMSGNATYVLS